MNKQIIGTNAGIIWRLLDNHRKWTLADLKQASGMSEADFYAAIGWLAREDKIQFQNNNDGCIEFLYLDFNDFIG